MTSLGINEPDDLEQRLRVEADRLLPQELVKSCASALVRAHRRRNRARMAGSFASVVLLVGTSVFLWSKFSNDTSELDHQRPLISNRQHDDGESHVARPKTNNNTRSFDANLQPPSSELPVVISLTAGRELIATGYYVPEQVEQVRFDDLSSAEQQAVIRLIGNPEQKQFGPY